MVEASDKPESNFLRRWSQRKLAAAREADAAVPEPVAAPAAALPQVLPPVDDAPPAPPTAAPALPDVATLTFESDFKPFLAADVDEGTRRAALRKLFADPHFNTMDGLDVYIDDYSKFEPITPEVLKQLRHARYLFDPPRTRVNEQGHVEDVVDAPEAAGQGDAQEGEQAPALPDADVPAPDALSPVERLPASPTPPEPAEPKAER